MFGCVTCYLNGLPSHREAMRVERFGFAHATLTRERVPRRWLRSRALVRVTHASVGVTDAMAVRGDYLFQPLPGFVPGYDFVGTIQCLPDDDRSGLVVGQRVAGILPRMGAHASLVSVAPSLLIPVPDGLDSPTAATVPLDAVTARFALDLLALNSGQVLVQGVGGAVGAWAAQLAAARGLTVYGTASSRSRGYAERFAATVLDYRNPAWVEQLLGLCSGGVGGAIDHTGSRVLRQAVRPGGRIVRTAFGGAPGRQRTATATGFLASALRRYARPDERVCSVPILVATRRSRYRRTLARLLDAVSSGALLAPHPRCFSVAGYSDALTTAVGGEPGEKVVLAFPLPGG